MDPRELRGLESRTGTLLSFRYVTLEGIDLSQSRGQFHFFESELLGSRFDGARLGRGVSIRRRFERCSLRSATIRDTVLGRTLIDCDFAGAAVVDCTFESASLSVLTTFSRCSFRGSIPVIGVAKISGSTHDGTTILNRWIDEEDAEDATERRLERYITAATAGEQDEMPLDP